MQFLSFYIVEYVAINGIFRFERKYYYPKEYI